MGLVEGPGRKSSGRLMLGRDNERRNGDGGGDGKSVALEYFGNDDSLFEGDLELERTTATSAVKHAHVFVSFQRGESRCWCGNCENSDIEEKGDDGLSFSCSNDGNGRSERNSTGSSNRSSVLCTNSCSSSSANVSLSPCSRRRAAQICIPHIMQEENWDCGLASLKMVLFASRPGIDPARLSNSALLRAVGTKSIWTIDLAYSLAAWEMQFVFYTISMQTNTSLYRGLPFYKEIENDEARVNRYFTEAKANGVAVVNCSLSGNDVVQILLGELTLYKERSSASSSIAASSHSPNSVGRCAIVLVDINFMRAHTRDRPRRSRSSFAGNSDIMRGSNSINSSISSLTRSQRNYGCWFLEMIQENLKSAVSTASLAQRSLWNNSYSGHYIVLVDYCRENNEFEFRDPASTYPSCFVDAVVLETARKAIGTDEDIIFLDLPTSSKSAI